MVASDISSSFVPSSYDAKPDVKDEAVWETVEGKFSKGTDHYWGCSGCWDADVDDGTKADGDGFQHTDTGLAVAITLNIIEKSMIFDFKKNCVQIYCIEPHQEAWKSVTEVSRKFGF